MFFFFSIVVEQGSAGFAICVGEKCSHNIDAPMEATFDIE